MTASEEPQPLEILAPYPFSQIILNLNTSWLGFHAHLHLNQKRLLQGWPVESLLAVKEVQTRLLKRPSF